MKIEDTIAAIEDGLFDDDLDEIREAVKDRRALLATLNFHSLKAEDTVRIVNASKKYLNGATAKVVEKRVTKVTIKFPEDMGSHDPYGKFAGKSWIFPAACLEKVES